MNSSKLAKAIYEKLTDNEVAALLQRLDSGSALYGDIRRLSQAGERSVLKEAS
jgi:hypothetical protein